MSTALAFLISGLLYFFPTPLLPLAVQWVVGGVALLFLLLVALTNLLLVVPLQWAEIKATPRVSELVKGDSTLRWLCLSLMIFPILSLPIAVGAISDLWLDSLTLFCIWLVFAGASFDLLQKFSSRLWTYFNPPAVVKLIVQRAQTDIAQGRDAELCDWIATLSETSLMSLKRHGSSLAERSINAIILLLQRFLEVHRRSLQTEGPDAKVHQRTTYVLFYGFERLQLIYNHALSERIEPICSHIVTSLGKVALAAAYGDINKMTFPLHYIGALASSALQEGLVDVNVKANLTLLEVGKLILAEVDLSKAVVKDPFVSLVGHLEDLAKASFRRDKESNILMLTQPLQDLKNAIQAHSLAERTDMKGVVAAIDGVLADFANLQLVLSTLPPIPEVPVTDEGFPDIPELDQAIKAGKKSSQPDQV